jgi:hypothetical protein
MFKKVILYFSLLFLTVGISRSATVYSQDGIRLNYSVEKKKVVFVPALKKKVIIWRSTIELVNSNNRPVSVTAPCCLYYAYCYLFPSEISAVREFVPNFQISDLYKAYATPKPTILKAKQKVSNEQYFATYEDVNLNDATYNLEVKYSF